MALLLCLLCPVARDASHKKNRTTLFPLPTREWRPVPMNPHEVEHGAGEAEVIWGEDTFRVVDGELQYTKN